jgi:hypothetical protein
MGQELVEPNGTQAPRAITITTNLAAEVASFTWTNSITDPWYAGSVELTLGLGYTQALTIASLMTDQVLLYGSAKIETNMWGRVYTNGQPAVTSIVNTVYTNILISDTTTNRANVIYTGEGKHYDGTYVAGDKRLPGSSYLHPLNVFTVTRNTTGSTWRVRVNGLR